MNNKGKSLFVVCTVVASFIFLYGMYMGWQQGCDGQRKRDKKIWQDEIVTKGYGKYVQTTNPSGEINWEFKWTGEK